ncbi:lysine exporter LysO family protein [Thermophagus sp. OGC60D27]|uniref:lysine exporter LysO family protein n=1 Tax=Thermophagus sp. OGC60D27 TaxID=3458415 RepID=UPI0040383012
MKGSLIIVSFFILGLLGGIYDIFPSFLGDEDLVTYTLFGLMLMVGMSTGADKEAFKILLQMNFKIILVPLLVIVGSLSGAAVVSFFLKDMAINEAMAVGAGFGYYSLSSVFISRLSGPQLGVVALLSNIFREILTLLLVPIMVRFFGKLAGIASGGATAMDTTLPVIVKYSGKEYGIIAVFSGITLTLLVPILVPLILNLF